MEREGRCRPEARSDRAGGILRLRLGWTNQASLAELQKIGSLKDLQRIVLVQGLGWRDVEIFDRAGLRTYAARSEKLLRLVKTTGCSCFPAVGRNLKRKVLL